MMGCNELYYLISMFFFFVWWANGSGSKAVNKSEAVLPKCKAPCVETCRRENCIASKKLRCAAENECPNQAEEKHMSQRKNKEKGIERVKNAGMQLKGSPLAAARL